MGKSDVLDAPRIAMAVLLLPVDWLPRPRLHDGVPERADPGRGAGIHEQGPDPVGQRAQRLVRGNDLGIDARQKLTDAQITEVSK